jgi:hypothetical protein
MIDHGSSCGGQPCTCGAKKRRANLLRSQAMMGNKNAQKKVQTLPEEYQPEVPNPPIFKIVDDKIYQLSKYGGDNWVEVGTVCFDGPTMPDSGADSPPSASGH